jgi:hypothetical protein
MRGVCVMGTFFNPDNEPFMKTIRSGKYVDKTMLIDFTNSTLNTENEYICVSRPRRFGKSIAVKMLCAYYSKGCQSDEIFDKLEISKTENYKKELNNSNVIFMDIQWMRSVAFCKSKSESVVEYIQEFVINELRAEYPEILKDDSISLASVLKDINQKTGEQFIIIIDEWDCFFREDKDNKELQEKYINFLRSIFKSVNADRFIKLAYITGILPIKKYGTQSVLNNFYEYTMVNPMKLAPYVGFTEDEVKQLCEKNSMDFAECKSWYDGYSFRNLHSVYSPDSVTKAVFNEKYDSYWTETDTYEILKHYIEMNFNGLKDAIIRMLGGERQRIKTRSFQNDMTSVKSKDDVMTLLVHLGYLAYDSEKMEVYIPNREVAEEFENAVEEGSWSIIANALSESEDLLEATINGEADFVAEQLDKIHSDNSSVLAYNNELSLSCAITIAYYSAQREYSRFRELPTGKGFADIVFIPRKNCDKPAMIIELKWDKNADTAIKQIKEKRYVGHLDEYAGNLLLVGINYDKETKKHDCVIEQFKK